MTDDERRLYQGRILMCMAEAGFTSLYGSENEGGEPVIRWPLSATPALVDALYRAADIARHPNLPCLDCWRVMASGRFKIRPCEHRSNSNGKDAA